jgi:outer membrane protein OmpA-like peptidoglycan-associated protein
MASNTPIWTGSIALAWAFGLALATANVPALARCGPPPVQAPLAEASAESLVDLLAPLSQAKCLKVSGPPAHLHRLCRTAVRTSKAAETSGQSMVEAARYEPDDQPSVDLSFDFNSSGMGRRESELLNNLAKALLHPRLAGSHVVVAGHTDSTGGQALNLGLSCRRALAVRAYLMNRGVAGHRMTIYGLGSEKPKEGMQPLAPQNRRVDIHVAPQ